MRFKFSLLVISILLTSTLIVLNPIHATEDNSDQLISDSKYNIDKYVEKFKYSFNSPDTEPIMGISKSQSNTKFVALDQGLTALNYLLYADQLVDFDLKKIMVDKALTLLKFSTFFLINPYLRDTDGIIEYWDINLEDGSYAKVIKNSRDQAILLLAIDKALTYIENEQFGYSDQLDLSYSNSLQRIWKFLDSLYDYSNGGWFSKATSINQSHYSIDTSKRSFDNLIIIQSLLDLTHLSDLGISEATISNKISQTLNFFRSEMKINNVSITSFGNVDGSFINDNTINAKENALYGYINTLLYQKTNESIYLNEAKNVWRFLVDRFLKPGFGGLFASINTDFDIIIAGKPLEDQLFFSLLSLNLATLEPSNTQYLSYWLTTNELIQLNYVNNFRVASSTDLRFNPSSEYFSRSAMFYYYYLLKIPHIIDFNIPSEVIIGSQAELGINSKLIPNLRLNLTLESDILEFNQNNYFENEKFTTSLKFKPDVTVGSKKLTLSLVIDFTILQVFLFSIDFLANIKIPNGLIYLGGALLLALLIIVIRRPPELIKKYIEDLNRFQTSIKTDSKDDTQ